MQESLHSRLTVFLSITALHLAGLWWLFAVMTQAQQQLPSAAPMVMAQLLPQVQQQPAPQPQKATPQPTPKPAPPEPPKQPAPKVVSQPVSQPKTIVSETALTAPKAPEKAVTAPAPVAVEKTVPPAAATAAPAAPTPPAAAAAPSPPAPIVAPRFNAAYLNNPPPAYPPLLRRMGEEGKVLLRVFVTAEGNAAEVRIQTSSGSPLFDEAAMNAVRHWRFVPARQGDAAVAAWVQVPIAFKLN